MFKKNSPINDIELDTRFMDIYKKCKPFTMTSIERSYALYKSCIYIIENNIDGDFVECGVWKGGSSMIIAYTLISAGENKRKIYLYDTFEGMSEPEDIDIDINNNTAKYLLKKSHKKTSDVWSYATKEEVENNIFSTSYVKENIILIQGKVEETIPNNMPNKIALLRLDTDWYSSTYHELIHMFPILTKSGILIIDDYGHWIGAKKAVDEYFKKQNMNLVLLNRIDYTGRILVKQ